MNKADVIHRQAILVVERLERLSVDSIWAHRASGLRGSILRSIGNYNLNTTISEDYRLRKLIDQGYEILKLAAKEIPDQDLNIW
jgi:hypothetical protein